MSGSTQPNLIVDVAIGIVVDKVSSLDGLVQIDQGLIQISASPRVLITRRKANQVLGGYWELPGGKLEPNESPADAVKRELREEVGIEATPIKTLTTVEHRYDHAHVRLIPFICEHTAGTPEPLHVDEVRWVTPQSLADYAFPEASQPILAELTRWLEKPAR